MPTIPRPASGKTVLADYFLGLSTRPVSGGARPWQLHYESFADAGLKSPRCPAAHSGDLYVAPGIKDIASTYYPSIGPYDVADPHVAEYHVLLAKAAGIDGFMTEFTIGQEAKLLNLVRAAKAYDFRVGVNWISQSHLGENVWRDRAEAIARAHEVVRFFADEVYKPCGPVVDGKYLLLIFLAHPREPGKPFDPFFSPAEVRDLKATMADAGCDADILVLPWEPLPDLPAGETAGPRVWDGYFPWIWLSPATPPGTAWTHHTTREQHLARLRDYYERSERLKRQGRIGTYIGAVAPGFDDHRGQAWGEGYRRHLPRDGGRTLADSWEELKRSGVSTALIVTWNDWVESTQIEPSLELGDQDLRECAEQVASWKGTKFDRLLLLLPERLLRARRDADFLAAAGVSPAQLAPLLESLDTVARAIAAFDAEQAALRLTYALARFGSLRATLPPRPVHVFWNHGFDSVGLGPVGYAGESVNRHNWPGLRLGTAETSTIPFAVDDSVRPGLRDGHLVATLCLEYLDDGTDFVEVLVDAADSGHQVIAGFKKTDSGRWLKASLDLVNARFARGLPGGADLLVRQRPGTSGAIRSLRIDGAVYRAPAAS